MNKQECGDGAVYTLYQLTEFLETYCVIFSCIYLDIITPEIHFPYQHIYQQLRWIGILKNQQLFLDLFFILCLIFETLYFCHCFSLFELTWHYLELLNRVSLVLIFLVLGLFVVVNAYMFVHTKDGYVVVQIKDVTCEGLTSLNFYIIKFYDFYLFKYIHWNRACDAFMRIWDN